jgi:hypothetical protein
MQIDELKTGVVPTVFLLKVAFGLALNWIYSNYYTDRSTADVFKYFDDSLVLYKAFYSNTGDFFQMLFGIGNDNTYFNEHYYQFMNHWVRPFGTNYYNDTHLLIRFNAVVRFFSFGHFGVHVVFANFFSLLGLITLYKTIQQLTQPQNKLTLYGLFFLPSLLFWGSGVLKEGFLLCGLAFLLLSFFRLAHDEIKPKWLLLFIAMSYLILRLKFYVLLALIPAMIAYLWSAKRNNRKTPWRYLITSALLLGIGLNLRFIHPELDLLAMLRQKQIDFICLAEYMNSGSSIYLEPMQTDAAGLFSALPRALYNGLFRPWAWEYSSAFTALSGIENTLLLIIMVFTLAFHRKNNINLNLLLFCLTFILTLSTLIGLTTPVIGAIVRYRIPVLPFYFMLIALWSKPFNFDRYLSKSSKR